MGNKGTRVVYRTTGRLDDKALTYMKTVSVPWNGGYTDVDMLAEAVDRWRREFDIETDVEVIGAMPAADYDGSRFYRVVETTEEKEIVTTKVVKVRKLV